VIRRRTAILILVLFLVALGLAWLGWRRHARPPGLSPNDAASSAIASSNSALPPNSVGLGSTEIYAHNLVLRKGAQFRIYIRWLRGKMVRTKTNIDPSFDNPDSFVLVIEKGVIHANLGDIGDFLNSTTFPLKNIVVRGQGDQVKLTGTLHKLHIPLPVELLSTVSPTADGRIHLHVDKINVLKGGTLDFGKLSMHPVDLTLIDASSDVWFDLDLVNYQAQLVNGYSRMTSQQGLEIFMPDLDELNPKKQGQKSVTMEWLQNRSKGLPADVPFK
jgi:hypothetical protein